MVRIFGGIEMAFRALAVCAALLLSAPVGAQPATGSDAADPAALQAAADYGAGIAPLIQDATALMSEMIELSGRYLRGFTDVKAYAADREALSADHQTLRARVAGLQAKAAATPEPASGPHAARGAELKRYVLKFSADMAEMQAALDRLPALVDDEDAEGFDAARGVLFRYSTNALRAENALLTTSQLSAPIGHPEYHLIEAIKNGNSVVAGLLDLNLAAVAGERDGLDGAAEEIAAHHKGIGVSLDAAGALADTLKRTLAAQGPALNAQIAAFIGAYRTAFEIERRIADALGGYVPIARKVASGADPAKFKKRLDKIGVKVESLVAERQVALRNKQSAAIALVSAAKSPGGR